MFEKLNAPNGRVVCKVDVEGKNTHTFSNGTTIRLEREYNNLDRKHTQPINATVIDAENIPQGAEILVHHNATTDTYRIFDYGGLSGKTEASDIKYFSIPEDQCFIWRMGTEEWQPLKGFATGLRVYEPYNGILHGIEPKKIKNALYITSGEFKGMVVRTIRASDYELVFQDSNGQENKIIRCRHYENEDNDREEIIAIDHDATKKVTQGTYYIGLSISTAKKLTDYERRPNQKIN